MKTTIKNEKNMIKKVSKIGFRHSQALLFFFCLIVIHVTRGTMSLAIVAMTEKSSPNPNVPVYDWKNTNIILSSFFWTYFILQLFTGYIFKKFGFKQVLLVGILWNSAAFASIPFCAKLLGANLVIAIRMLQGFFQAFTYPACQTVLGVWAPVEERSKLSFLVYSGSSVGAMISMTVTGWISSSWYGWPLVFYIFGAFGVIWCVFWFFLGFESPAQHPWISDLEKNYIENSLEHTEENKETQKIPLKAILTSVPFWALQIGNMGNSWANNIIDSDIPTFFSKIYGLDINSNGLISATPQITQLVVMILTAPLPDYIVSKGFVSLTNCRRIFQFLGAILPSVVLIGLAYTSKSEVVLGVILLNVIIGLNSLLLYASQINHVDLAPKYAGTLVGIENSCSMGVAMTGPIFVQYFVTELTDINLWRYVFIVMSITMTLTTLVFIIFGSAKVQWWNFTRRKENRNDPL
ncbi:vesicular glutamate transporter 1-like isoform X2 [Sitophilus oryzae]|uniref:Putative inorganic phosphate cotransporter n=1 Tax=Sitophilus oryzae TaxID=7048 RepID=A0A6J2YAH0_SITOR|nr:vesicular glutamate transporter 1-like isoform X2 [Sitophilus oryzae]